MEEAEFHPFISSVQKIAMYETKARFYLMGSNNMQTRFRVLKIDRMEHLELSVVDDRQEYSQEEIREMVTMIDIGNRTRIGHRNASSGVSRVVSAFGIVGFVRFLEGYYIILVTKRRKVGVIGHHTIYKIEDTSMVYIPSPGLLRHSHPDEARYVKMFQSIDLSSNFYFSYSYDITHSLQTNMARPCNFGSEAGLYGTRNKPNERFIWNSHLLTRVESSIHPDWFLYVMHGFVGQSNVSVFGRSIYVTLVARRSNKYAGTRFLKRGSNFKGDVGNEVETEQIVHESGVSSLSRGRFSSFVQMRGSIPAQWSQDVSKMVPKPTISLDVSDPFAEVAGQHFDRLLRAYGAPIVILDLVKKREKKKHESTLSQELSQAVSYLNQFLPPRHRLQYVSLDMARANKGKEANVMHRLAAIAYNAIHQTGFYQSQKPYSSRCAEAPVQLQTGVVRTNCVDCLDRTNTAQFAVGKCALGLQLYALGLAVGPQLEFDSDCVRMLEELYEDHGDTLALQYGGSQLVHRIKTYRKTAPWTSQGNDIMQTLSRYYSNTFSDTEKQHTINLFLGLFVPNESEPPIWEHLSDQRLHNPRPAPCRQPLTQWWDEATIKCLPRAFDQVTKTCTQVMKLVALDETVDGYLDYHRPNELSVLSDVYAYKISHSVKDFMPHFTTDFSPFAVRVRPGRRRDETGSGSAAKYPSLTDRRWAVSTASSASSSTESDDSDDEETEVNTTLVQESLPRQDVTYECLFPTTKQTYGVEVLLPRESDIHLYKRCIAIGRVATKMENNSLSQRLVRLRTSTHSFVLKTDPTSEQVYTTYVLRGLAGAALPNTTAISQYQYFITMLS